MIRTLLVSALAGGAGFLGWIGGSIWPAPPQWTDAVNRNASDLRAQLRLQDVSFADLKKLAPGETFSRLRSEISSIALAAGEMIEIEHDAGTLEEQLDNLAMDETAAVPVRMTVVDLPSASPAPPAGAAGDPGPVAPEAAVTPAPKAVVMPGPVGDPSEVFAASLDLCPRMDIANAPRSANGVVTGYKPVVLVKSVRIATFPTPGACMSSGFGRRSERLHKGLDYHADIGVPVLAGGDGTILEIKFRDDYGNMILIDHGGGVYTRYAHLASFGKGLTPGVSVRAGEALGLMGNTASYQIPMHLHYELLVGDYSNPKGSFGLEPEDPMSFPAAG